MDKQKKDFLNYCFLIFIISFIPTIFAGYASALPPLPTEFYGRIRDFNYNASAGGIVQAYDSNGVMCGSFVIVNNGSYGLLTCKGDDPETEIDEGAAPGESIVFKYKGSYTTTMGDNTWDYGTFKYVNLTYPVVFCGDNFCDAMYENNYTCPADCPSYNFSYNYSINITNMTYNYSGGGGTPGGGGGIIEYKETEEAQKKLAEAMNFTGYNLTGMEGLGIQCQENWVCTNWSDCRIDGLQNRSCKDLNECGTFELKPLEVQKCVYTPTCFDGAKNGLEEGIDCGGLCPPCISCYDGIQNCHEGSCEEGIDCGGPCGKKCPIPQMPIQVFVCKKEFNPLAPGSLLFFIIVLLAITCNIAYSRHKMEVIKKNKELSEIKRIKKIYLIKKRMYLFAIIVLLLSIVLYLYYYFFIMCETEYRFFWILLVLLLLIPLSIHQVIRMLEYNEKKRYKKIEALLNTHYKQVNNLIRLENENLIELEEEIADELYQILASFRNESQVHNWHKQKKVVNEEVDSLKKIYKELVSLYTSYKEKKNPLEEEKLLCDEIYSLLEKPEYQQSFKADPRLERVATKLKLLYKQYEQKQKLYDEMSKIEYSKEELKEGMNEVDDNTEEERESKEEKNPLESNIEQNQNKKD